MRANAENREVANAENKLRGHVVKAIYHHMVAAIFGFGGRDHVVIHYVMLQWFQYGRLFVISALAPDLLFRRWHIFVSSATAPMF